MLWIDGTFLGILGKFEQIFTLDEGGGRSFCQPNMSLGITFDRSVSLMQQINDSKCLLSVFGTEKGHPQVDLKVRRPTTTTK